MYGQVTVEYLLISLIGLVLISFSIISLAQIKESSTDSYEAILFKESASELANAADTVCALGNYNSRSIYIKSKIDVEGDQRNDKFFMVVTETNSSRESAKETLCLVNGKKGAYGKTKITNKNGEIYLES
jgi:uncharacterized protein (UPF0333 family)